MLINNKLKYNLFFLLLVSSVITSAQVEEEQSVVTIIGNPVAPTNSNPNQTTEYTQGYINTVNYQTQAAPPEKGELSNEQKTIEPTLENGMHMRFQIETPEPSADRLAPTGYASLSGGNYSASKSRKNTKTISKRVYKWKKKIKSWLPKRKKKYRPDLCVDFK